MSIMLNPTEESYNQFISRVGEEFQGLFTRLASPTLSKQETITHLRDQIESSRRGNEKVKFPWLRLVQFLPRLMAVFLRLCYGAIRFKVKHLPLDCVYFRSWLEPRCVAGVELIDEHFRRVPHEIGSSENVVIALHPYDYSLLKNFDSLNNEKKFIVPVGLLSLFDVIKLMVDYLANGLLISRRVNIFNGVDVTDLINHSLLVDYLQMRSFTAFQEKYICMRLLPYRPKAFIYVYENQSWEKVCCFILKAQKIKLAGVQGSGFSPVFLNFFPTELDAKNSPAPDVIYTVGDYFTKYLQENGCYKIPVKTLFAARFPYQNNGNRYKVFAPNKKILKKILYAFSVHTYQYKEIIIDLIAVFANTDIHVDLKFHPQFRHLNIDGIDKLPENFSQFKECASQSFADTYDFVLFNDNSFGVESMIVGVKSFQYNRIGYFEDNRLFYFDLWDANLDFSALLNLRDQLLNGTYNKLYDIDLLEHYINLMYKPYIGNVSELLTFINSN